jgi:hypothetical protein
MLLLLLLPRVQVLKSPGVIPRDSARESATPRPVLSAAARPAQALQRRPAFRRR